MEGGRGPSSQIQHVLVVTYNNPAKVAVASVIMSSNIDVTCYSSAVPHDVTIPPQQIHAIINDAASTELLLPSTYGPHFHGSLLPNIRSCI